VKAKKVVLTVEFTSREKVESALRIPNGQKHEIREEFEKAWQGFLSLKVTPIALFSSFLIQKDSPKEGPALSPDPPNPDWIWLEPHIPFPFNPAYAKDCHTLFIGLITLGSGLEDTATKAFRDGESLKGWILDRIGTLLLRKAVSALLDQRRRETEGYFGPRYAPGCPPIPLSGQKRIFDLLDASLEGMRMTQGYMIHPVKTATFVSGIGMRAVLAETSLCRTCERTAFCYRDGLEAEKSIKIRLEPGF